MPSHEALLDKTESVSRLSYRRYQMIHHMLIMAATRVAPLIPAKVTGTLTGYLGCMTAIALRELVLAVNRS